MRLIPPIDAVKTPKMTLEHHDIERIAARVADLLRADLPTQEVKFVTAAVIARELGVDRDWVYAHAQELGAVRLGGEHGRLRFDLIKIRQRLAVEGPRTNRRRNRKQPVGVVDRRPHLELPLGHQISGRAALERPRPDNGK